MRVFISPTSENLEAIRDAAADVVNKQGDDPGRRQWLAMVLSLLLSSLAIASPATAEWPQWRGTDGLGVSAEPGPLPQTWNSTSSNIRWRARIPGEGHSSPIVSRGRVFVTTAYESPKIERLQGVLRAAAVGLALIALLLLGRRWWLGEPRWETRIVTAVSAFFAFAALAVAARPELFFDPSNPGRVWRVGGGVALLGLAAAAGQFERAGAIRLSGGALVLFGSFLLIHKMPPGPLGPAPPSKWLPFVALPLMLTAWSLASFWWKRSAPGPRAARTPGAAAVAVSLVLLSALVFVPGNVLNALLRAVVCVDLESGEILWDRAVFSGPPEQKWPGSTYATPTAATDGEHVFAYFGLGIASLDLDGRLEWSRRFPEYAHSSRYGAAASPVVSDEAVIVVQEQEMNQAGPPSWIAAFDKRSGRPLWRVEPSDARDSYGTPLLVDSVSGAALITASWEHLAAYDVDSGDRLWSHPYPMKQLVASMARSGDLLAITGGIYDPRGLLVLKLRGADAEASVEALWDTHQTVATISSPVFYDGMLFSLAPPGIMSCYEDETGTVLWRERLDGEHFASLVAGDGKVYAINTEGVTAVVAAAPEFELLATNELDERVYASPAIADGCLLIRTASSLFCVEG